MIDKIYKKLQFNKAVFGWALYDWANSAFSTTVMAGFFPLFFKSYFSQGYDASISTAQLGIGNSLGTFLVAMTAPVLGKISDEGGTKKLFLGFFCIVGAFFTIGLGFIQEGSWILAILFYVIASLAHASSFAFYDALLVEVSSGEEMHFVSSLGYAFGYLGGGLLFLIHVLMFQFPALFGISHPIWAIKIAFMSVGVWWVLFTIPLFFWVKEKSQKSITLDRSIVKESFYSFFKTIKELKKFKTTLLFLSAYFIYNDGVGTTIRMAVDYGMSIGFQNKDLILALLLVQFVGFPSALLIGKLAHFISAKKIILICLMIYIGIIFCAFRMVHAYEFYVLAVMIGLVQGGVQALSRSFFALLIPTQRSGEFFGLYNILGRFAGMIGPLLMSVTVLATNNPRYSILSISILFIVGAFLLFRVKEAHALEEFKNISR